jgi:hypothetical protein
MVSVRRIAVFALGGLLVGALIGEVIEMMVPAIRRTEVIGATRSQSSPATPAVVTTQVDATPSVSAMRRAAARVNSRPGTRKKATPPTMPESHVSHERPGERPETAVIDSAGVSSNTEDPSAAIDWLLTRSSNR